MRRRFLHIAKTGEEQAIYIVGGYTADGNVKEIWKTTNGVNWTLINDNCGFGERKHHQTLYYDNKIWVIGGNIGGTKQKDVWYSSDFGLTWTQATDNASFLPREHHSCCVHDGKMWLVGGYTTTYKKDVWYSTDGSTWTQATSASPWTKRYLHNTLSYDGKLWMFSGGIWDTWFRDVWYTTDGSTWKQATSTAKWSKRYGAAALVYDDKMWIIGGRDNISTPSYRYDAWYSTDGSTWTEATSNKSELGRVYFSACNFRNKIYITGGVYSGGVLLNDVYYSSDGSTWTEATSGADFSGRILFGSLLVI